MSKKNTILRGFDKLVSPTQKARPFVELPTPANTIAEIEHSDKTTDVVSSEERETQVVQPTVDNNEEILENSNVDEQSNQAKKVEKITEVKTNQVREKENRKEVSNQPSNHSTIQTSEHLNIQTSENEIKEKYKRAKPAKYKELKKCTLYLTQETMDALAIMKIKTKKDLSELTEEAIKLFLESNGI